MASVRSFSPPASSSCASLCALPQRAVRQKRVVGAACATHALANGFHDHFGLLLPIWAARVGSVEARSVETIDIAVAPVHNRVGVPVFGVGPKAAWVGLLRSHRKSEAPALSNMSPMPSRKVLEARVGSW